MLIGKMSEILELSTDYAKSGDGVHLEEEEFVWKLPQG